MKSRFLSIFIFLLTSSFSLFAGKEQFQLLSIVKDEPDVIKIDETNNWKLDLHAKNLYSLEGINQLDLKKYHQINFERNTITSLEPLEKLAYNTSDTLSHIYLNYNDIRCVLPKTLIHLKKAFPKLKYLCLADNPLENSKTIKKSYNRKKVGYKIILKHLDNE